MWSWLGSFELQKLRRGAPVFVGAPPHHTISLSRSVWLNVTSTPYFRVGDFGMPEFRGSSGCYVTSPFGTTKHEEMD